ncbi:hypothetical protein C6V06_30230 [Burkholderia gladioli]|nr:hypothetical protein CEJ98_31670 [Burkholderia gladioli pv. gladioli]PRE12919.1 hypothetical protein C6P72_30240 [Burkholderia gladioli]AWY50854.1 hypothetical protein A8H28_06435 [Burkholderia gladioli pv. gladioli]PRG45684.1 hypothetical protein C6V06_30230 [Burkholderia gladioli]PRH03313.1 hypothetical protein C6V08_12440 [Burkholderia gladioli]
MTEQALLLDGLRQQGFHLRALLVRCQRPAEDVPETLLGFPAQGAGFAQLIQEIVSVRRHGGRFHWVGLA